MHRSSHHAQRRLWPTAACCAFVLVLLLRRSTTNTESRKTPAERLWPSDDAAQRLFWSSTSTAASSSCPLVYVYPLRDELIDKPIPSSSTQILPGIFVTSDLEENANLLEVVLDRLGGESSRCSTTDPARADLFLVPILPRVKHWSEWVEKCVEIAPIVNADRLEHLSEENARRHFFIFPRVGYMPKCTGWWANPMPPLVQKFARVAVGGYEEFSGQFQRTKTLAVRRDDRAHPENLIPRLVSAPYVANVRWSKDFQSQPPWQQQRQRHYLFSYAASPHGSEDAVALRTHLGQLCVDSPLDCITATDRVQSTLAKINATFCLEPPGLTPGRSSIVTALLLGCIPVLFAPEQDLLWPLHWGDWIEQSRLYIDANSILRSRSTNKHNSSSLRERESSSSSNLIELLRSVPFEKIKTMQATIADRAHSLQYALDNHVPGDALEVLLLGLNHAAAVAPR